MFNSFADSMKDFRRTENVREESNGSSGTENYNNSN